MESAYFEPVTFTPEFITSAWPPVLPLGAPAV